LTAQPLFELGMAKEDVKARLAPIPVYTVANPKNEFVLVAGEVSSSRVLDLAHTAVGNLHQLMGRPLAQQS
jgi:hypothetical protein